MQTVVYIPTKGRAGAAKTMELCQAAGLFPILVVERQEANAYFTAYRDHYGTLLTLPESNQGIGYVRQFILENARAAGFKWFWMLDDDIASTGFAEDGKNIIHDIKTVLKAAEQIIQAIPGAAQGALEYAQFSWAQKKPFTLNSYCDVAVLINTALTRSINYRREMDLKEDRDFTLQILARGMKTVRASRCYFRAPANGSNAGGLQAEYQKANREREAVEKMVKAWPGIITTAVKPNGRFDCKIAWKTFR